LPGVEAYAIGVVFDDQGYRMRRKALFREGVVAHAGEKGLPAFLAPHGQILFERPDGAKFRPFSGADSHLPPPALLVRFAFAEGQDGAFRGKFYILYIQPHKFAISESAKEAHK
jgi:hypothetical protein